MNIKKKLFLKLKRVIFLILYVVYLLFLLEISSRGFWAIRHGVPFFKAEEIFYVFYPSLQTVKQEEIHLEDDYFDILLLGGSVLTPHYGSIPSILQEKLISRTKKAVRIHNVAQKGHTSLDSYYKYSHLMDKNFDVVIFYHGINEVRANNIPTPHFKNDYSHYYWYETIQEFKQSEEIRFITFPFTFKYLRSQMFEYIQSLEIIPPSSHIPMYKPPKEWLRYGTDIKTVSVFQENIVNLIEIASHKKETIFFMTFAYHIPKDYSLTRFKEKTLDFELHRHPIEIWGEPENVKAGISAHNEVIENIARSKSSDNLKIIDQNKLIPKDGKYFDDICHLTYQGSEMFVDNTLEAFLEVTFKR